MLPHCSHWFQSCRAPGVKDALSAQPSTSSHFQSAHANALMSAAGFTRRLMPLRRFSFPSLPTPASCLAPPLSWIITRPCCCKRPRGSALHRQTDTLIRCCFKESADAPSVTGWAACDPSRRRRQWFVSRRGAFEVRWEDHKRQGGTQQRQGGTAGTDNKTRMIEGTWQPREMNHCSCVAVSFNVSAAVLHLFIHMRHSHQS